MAVELKEVFEFLGYKPEEIKDIADLKTKFDSEFVRAKNINEDSEPVKKIVGQVYSTISTELKKIAKANEVEIDFEADEYKSIKKATDKVDYVIKKLAQSKDSTIEELKTNASKGNDEKVREWEKKYEKIKKAKEDAENLLQTTTTQFEGYKQTASSEIKNSKLSFLKKDALGKVKFKPDITDIETKGYVTTIEEKYNFDIDENEVMWPTDKKGNKIPNPKVTGTFKSTLDILQEEAIAGKLVALNQDAGKAKPSGLNIGQQPPAQNPNSERQVAPRMR